MRLRSLRTVPLTNSASADLNENLEIRQDILALVNKVRQEHGLSAVPADPSLMDAAQDYATRRNTWHDSQEECELALAHGYPYGFNCNLTVFTGASAEGAAKTAVENWVNSPGHLRTILDSRADGWSWCGAARGSDLLLSVCRHVKHNQPIRIMPYMRKAFQQPLEGFFLAKFN